MHDFSKKIFKLIKAKGLYITCKGMTSQNYCIKQMSSLKSMAAQKGQEW